MLKEERFHHILISLKQREMVDFETLSKQLDVSEDTIRRDIDILNKRGLLVKVRGGAIRPSKNPLSFQDREHTFTEGKDLIALKAVQLLDGVRTVFIDGGTTPLSLIPILPANLTLRIITNNIALAPALAPRSNIELILLGGIFNRATHTTNGAQTCVEASRFRADLFLMGTCAIDTGAGVTASLLEEAEIKKVMLANANMTVALSNHEKLQTAEFAKVCDITAIDGLCTDLPSDDERLDPFRKFDLEIW